MTPIKSEATKQVKNNAEISEPNLPWSILSWGISLTLTEPSRANTIPNPNTLNRATIVTISQSPFIKFKYDKGSSCHESTALAIFPDIFSITLLSYNDL